MGRGEASAAVARPSPPKAVAGGAVGAGVEEVAGRPAGRFRPALNSVLFAVGDTPLCAPTAPHLPPEFSHGMRPSLAPPFPPLLAFPSVLCPPNARGFCGVLTPFLSRRVGCA